MIKRAIFVCGLCLIFSVSCERIFDTEPNDPEIDCSKLHSGLLNLEQAKAATEINRLLLDLKPSRTKNDPIGHKNNFEIFAGRLKRNCKNIRSELQCYACMESNPPQSMVKLIVDSSGVDIERSADIRTPSTTNMMIVRIH